MRITTQQNHVHTFGFTSKRDGRQHSWDAAHTWTRQAKRTRVKHGDALTRTGDRPRCCCALHISHHKKGQGKPLGRANMMAARVRLAARVSCEQQPREGREWRFAGRTGGRSSRRHRHATRQALRRERFIRACALHESVCARERSARKCDFCEHVGRFCEH